MTAEGKPLMICTTARSGSNLLSDYLNKTKLFGSIGEFFNPNTIRSGYSDKRFEFDGGVSVSEYIDFLRVTHAGRSGRWGAKLLFEDVEHLIGFPAMQDMVRASSLLFLRRRNKLSQAISYYLARSTGKWIAADKGNAAAEQVPFDFDAIDRALLMLARQEALWTTLFEKFAVEAQEIIYEDLVDDPLGTVAKIIARTGQAIERISVTTTMVEQKNKVNEEFIQRYNEIKWARMADPSPIQYVGLTFKA